MISGKALNNQDFVVSLIRSQVQTLNDVLITIENTHNIEDYLQDDLKRVESNIRGLRKLFADN